MSIQRATEQPAALEEGLRQCRMAFLGAALISAIINLLFLSGPLFMLEVYDRVLPSHSLPTLVVLLGIVALLYCFQGMLDIVRSRILSRTGAVVSTCAASETFRMTLDVARNRRKGSRPAEAVNDLDQIRSFLGGPCLGALFDLPWIPLYLVVCFSFHPLIGLAALGGAFFLLLATVVTDFLSQKLMAQSAKHISGRAILSEESVRQAEVIRALGLQGRMTERWVEQNRLLVANQLRVSDVGSTFGAVSKAFRMFLQSGVLALGAYLVIEGEVTAGVIVASGILVSRALAPVELSIANWRNFIAARQSWRRLSKALQSAHQPRLMSLPPPGETLSVEGLALMTQDPARLILRDASFFLRAGEAMAVIGPSAAGKSSLARALVGLWSPAQGTVRLDGAPLDYRHSDELGLHIGYLPQEVELFCGTVADNISRFEPGAASEKVIAAARDAGVHDMILRLRNGYNTIIGEGGDVLSVGQRQRIGLARALFGKPFLVVLDEPNSNLDAEGEEALTGAINGVRKRRGIAVVIAHRASALAACDTIMMVSNGTVQMLGRKEDVMHRMRPVPSPVPQSPRPQAQPLSAEISSMNAGPAISSGMALAEVKS